MMPESPCYQCEKRSELCHSNCPEYKKYRAELDAYKEIVRKEKEESQLINSIRRRRKY